MRDEGILLPVRPAPEADPRTAIRDAAGLASRVGVTVALTLQGVHVEARPGPDPEGDADRLFEMWQALMARGDHLHKLAALPPPSPTGRAAPAGPDTAGMPEQQEDAGTPT